VRRNKASLIFYSLAHNKNNLQYHADRNKIRKLNFFINALMRSLYTLVFSNNLKYRITRHFIFWMLWISFYAFVESYRAYEMWHADFWSYFPIAWGSMLIQIPIDIAFCYSVIYFLLPCFFLKGRYFEFFLWWIVFAFATGILESQYYYWAVGAYRTWFGLKAPVKSASSFLGALEIVGSLNTEGGFAIAIKFGKMFAVKQKEAALLSSEKEQLKATFDSRVYDEVKPTFLFNVLNRLYSRTQETKVDAGESIKKINDLILYTSYDAKKTLLPLTRELESLKEYIELEKISYNYAVQAACNIKGGTQNKLIAPYILIPVAEYAFANIGNGTIQDAWINIEIIVEGNDLRAKFSSSKSSETSTLLGDKSININLIAQRLQLLYPGGHHLKKIIESEKLVIDLYVDLSMRLGI